MSPGIWAIGDVNGRGAFTHTSYNDYEIVAANLLDGDARSVDARIMTYAVFVDPPFARVGMSETRRARGRPRGPDRHDADGAGGPGARARRDGRLHEGRSSMPKTKQILGAAILGIEGDEAIHTFVDIMNAGAPYTTLQHAMHVHPTVCELVPTLLGMLKPLA